MPQDPSPPRWLDRNALATYISVRVEEIPRFVRAGKIPQLSYQLGPKSPRWWSAAIDEAFGMAPTPTPGKEAAGLAEAILKAGRPGRGPGQPQTAQEATDALVAKTLAGPARKQPLRQPPGPDWPGVCRR